MSAHNKQPSDRQGSGDVPGTSGSADHDCSVVRFTLYKNKGRLSKAFWRTRDGTLGSTAATHMWRGDYRVVTFDATDPPAALAEIGALLEGLTPEHAIGLGVPRDRSEGKITIAALYDVGGDGSDAIPRTKAYFSWHARGPGLLLLDGDDIEGLPAIMIELWPSFAAVALLVRPSVSASVIDPQTGKASKQGEHVFALIDQPELTKDCLDALMRLAWCRGHGWIKLTTAGSMLIRGPFDTTVGSPERLIYEGAADVGAQIDRLPRAAQVTSGGELLRTPDFLAYAEAAAPQAQYEALVAAAKSEPTLVAESAALKAVHYAKYVETQVARGVPRERAEANYAQAHTISHRDGDREMIELPAEHILYWPNGESFTVGDIQKNPPAYHERECADPMEGMSYKSLTCGFIIARPPKLLITSFAHGGTFGYFAPLPWFDWSTTLGPLLKAVAAANNDNYSMFKLFEIERLARRPQLGYEQRRKEAAKALGMRVGALDKMVGAARARDSKPEVDHLIALLNAKHALVLAGNKAAVMKFDTPTRFRLLQVGAFKQWFANAALVIAGNKAVSLGDYWLSHTERRQYAGIEFAPAETAAQPGFYNLWQGFAVEPRQGDCSKFLAHLKDNVARGDNDTYLWIVGWWAQIFQQPGVKLGTGLALRGEQGTGKTKIGEVFGAVLGEHFLSISSPRYITGQFNSHMSSLLVLHADEAFWAGDKKSEGILKDLVTGHWHMLEYKNIDQIRIRNYIRLFVTGNPNWIIPAGFRDRRWAVFDMGKDHMQDLKYFAAIDHEMDNGGREALLHFMLTFDLKQVDLRTIPRTAALLDQQIESMTSEQAWWFQTLMKGELPLQPDGCKEAGVVLKDDLYARYVLHTRIQGTAHRSIETKVGRFLSEQLGAELRILRLGTGERRLQCYGLPPLARCRQLFADRLGQTVAWGVSEGKSEEWLHDPGWRESLARIWAREST